MAFVASSFLGASAQRAAQTCGHSHSQAHLACPRMSQAGMSTLSRRAALTALSTGAATLLSGVGAVLADHTYVAAKRAYDRYYPRIVAGVAQVREVGSVVSGGDGSVAEIVDGRVFDVKLRRALSIYATSFSDNYLGETSRNLLKCVDAFYREMGKVKVATDREQGVEHYNRAVHALVNYFAVARLDKEVVKGLYL